MKYLKLLISFILYTFVTIFVGALSLICVFFEGKKAFGGLQQIFSIWKMLFSFLCTDTNRVTEKYQMKLHGKYKTFKNTEYISIDFQNFDLGETLLFAYFIIYTSFIAYVIAGVIISVLTISMVYINPEVKPTKEPIKKPVIAYQKMDDEINMDTYCPCTESFKYSKEDLFKTKNTLIVDNMNGTILVSDINHLTQDLMNTAKIEISQGEILVQNKSEQITFIQDGFEFKLNSYQGFVFIYDLSSLFYFDSEGQLFRIARP
jgi:hypothetical protein